MDLALDIFIFVFIIVIIFLTIFYSYHRSQEPEYVIGPISDGNYAIYYTPTVGGASSGFLSYEGDKIVNDVSSDITTAQSASIWYFENTLCSHGNNYHISQKGSDGIIRYLSSGSTLTTSLTKSYLTSWKVLKVGDSNFTISSMASSGPICLALIGDGFQIANYATNGNPNLCNFNGTYKQLIADGTRTVQLYGVA